MSLLALASVARAQPGISVFPCPNDDSGLEGYRTIGELNLDMESELQRIADGGEIPSEPYVFNLCPNLEFDLETQPLRPLLDGTTIICGRNGNPAEICLFSGGDTQVEISDSTLPGYTIGSVDIVGVTFSEFTESAVSGSASDATTVSLLNPTFSVSRKLRNFEYSELLLTTGTAIQLHDGNRAVEAWWQSLLARYQRRQHP